ncbi:MAG: dihydropteroate synthase [Alphaproteobacteria bacterium]|nr:dihydropteroate synthase [Alphaproteobacteria bacterium]MCL2506021.1 dihydropteroate synthase [Alphaproteobacteria bacterium]
MENGKWKIDNKKTLIMGIINLTEDSFYAPSRTGVEEVLKTAANMIEAGVDILDIGAESTRPGAERVPEAQELERIEAAAKIIKKHFPKVTLSADTTRASVAEAALKQGANIINDVSGVSDPEMLRVVKQYNAGLVLMHSLPLHDDIINDMVSFFNAKIKEITSYGINGSNIIIDVGLGFAKDTEQNLCILNNLDAFKALGYPLLIGHSRKRFTGGSLASTLAVSSFCADHGAAILRVHDVKENYEAVRMMTAIKNSSVMKNEHN